MITKFGGHANNQAGTFTKNNIDGYCTAVKGSTFWISIAIANSGRKLNYPIVNILIYSDVELKL